VTEVRVYSAGYHRFFDDLFNLLVSSISFGSAAEAFRGGDPTFGAHDRVLFQGRVTYTELIAQPSKILPPILEDRRPDRIELLEHGWAIDWSRVPGSKSRQEAKRVLAPVIHAAFVHYYESVLDQIVAARGPRGSWHQWPELVRFGKAVRDAFTHGGTIHFTDPKAPAATWRGLTYGPTQNGQQVLYTDLMPADVIILMEEMDDVIPR